MIKLESVSIENFRGIKNLSLNFRQNSFGIYGPNGTGKSGIVDAIEFGLTGNITRLTGRGAGEVSIKEHASHVDCRHEPSKSIVRIAVYSRLLDKSFAIERRVDKPRQPRVTPNDADTQALVKRLAQHPELALSRREIVKYIITEPGARSDQVQALLKLEEIGALRKALTTLTNKFKTEARAADDSLTGARAQLLSGLEISEAKTALILESVNKRRAVLSAELITAIEKGTNVSAGIERGLQAKRPSVNKATASADLSSLKQLAASQESPEIVEAIEKTRGIVARLEAEPALLQDLQAHLFLQKGLELVEADECPLCGVQWQIEELRLKIRARLDRARIAGELQAELQYAIQPFRSLAQSLSGIAGAIQQYAPALLPGRELAALKNWATFLSSIEDRLMTGQPHELRTWLDDHRRLISSEAEDEITVLTQAVSTLPDLGERDSAWHFLVIAQERLEVYMKAKAAAVRAKKHLETAAQIATLYATVSDEHLSRLYEEVQNDFSRYYALIHQEDESLFFAQLTPSIGKLGFAVDFYGRGTYPPGAYHSEGHQDSMGLCLYLALMKRTLGSDFTLSILDDVLMSVDAGHRRDVARLLKTEFPKTQFLFTTHDEVWLKHMINENLISRDSCLQIRRWTVDVGPCVLGANDVWAEISAELAVNDVLRASALLRNYLERMASTLAERLRAQVEYRSDNAHDFGDLISPVLSRWKDLLRKAKEAASSWNDRAEVECLDDMERRFTALYGRANIDNWMVNKSVHYNEWANLQKQDFAPLVEAYRAFLACFECPSCKVLYYVTPNKGKAEQLRCRCNMFNLLKNSQPRDKAQLPTSPKKPRVTGEERELFKH